MSLKHIHLYSIDDHNERFRSDQDCYNLLVQTIWNGIPTCPACGHKEGNTLIKNRNYYLCKNKECNKQFSVTKGTIFENTRLPLQKWFKAIFHFVAAKNGISSIQLASTMGLHQKTAWTVLHRIRHLTMEENNRPLNGRVQVDETFIAPSLTQDRRMQWRRDRHKRLQREIHGLTKAERKNAGEKRKRGRKKGQTKEVLQKEREARGGMDKVREYDKHEPFERGAVLLGMVGEKFNVKTGKTDNSVVIKKLGRFEKNINAEAVMPFLEKQIDLSSTLVTDQNTIYNNVPFKKHITVTHSVKYVDKEGNHTNGIENNWMQLQRTIRGNYMHISYHHMNSYLDEYSFHKNRIGYSNREKFDEIIAMACGKTLSVKEINNRRPSSAKRNKPIDEARYRKLLKGKG